MRLDNHFGGQGQVHILWGDGAHGRLTDAGANYWAVTCERRRRDGVHWHNGKELYLQAQGSRLSQSISLLIMFFLSIGVVWRLRGGNNLSLWREHDRRRARSKADSTRLGSEMLRSALCELSIDYTVYELWILGSDQFSPFWWRYLSIRRREVHLLSGSSHH